jgi:hypothetical protein
MSLIMRASMIELTSMHEPKKTWTSRWLEVVDVKADVADVGSVSHYGLVCDSLMSDMQSAEGSGRSMLRGIAEIESGVSTYIEADGNAWIAFITPHEVWFEGLYDQGSGGAVSFRQYKLAVETWIQFLSDPERKPIVVPFPEDVLDPATLPPRPPRNEE